MALDHEPSAPRTANRLPHTHHAGGVPHSHGGGPGRTAVAASNAGAAGFRVAISVLRVSIATRLLVAVIVSSVIWGALHWAIA